ncbi:unnamed protein product [Moneuplotes crassus]|uniref:Tubulin-tyrosine ligase family protein n=1 Tax=Euplotes crassus TaxID=5936 RepID=A0AAD2D1L9_EUPCR|nr:unnamed protein product [Moneuplotes crassus]
MSTNGIVFNSETAAGEKVLPNFNRRNMFQNISPEPSQGTVFGGTEEQEELVLSRMEYTNKKYIKFKQKMNYIKDRQSKLKFTNYDDHRYGYVPMKLNRKRSSNFPTSESIFKERTSTYQKAIMKEEERKKILQLKKNECMTQRAQAEFRDGSVYKVATFTRPFNKMKFQWRQGSRDHAAVKTQKSFLAVQGRKKNIQADHAFLNAKKLAEFHADSQNNFKGEREAPIKRFGPKELKTRDVLNSNGKKLIQNKPKPRNKCCNTSQGFKEKSQEDLIKHKNLNQIERKVTEKSHSRKESIIEKTLPEDKDEVTRNLDKSISHTSQPKLFRKPQGVRVGVILANSHDEVAKEKEKKLALRKKATEIYNNLSSNYKINSQKQCLKYIIMKGNNSNVIERCMKLRPGWEQTAQFDTMFNFKWQQTSQGIKFNQLSTNGKKQLVNHMENHAQITTKDNLFKNLCENLDKKVFEYVPMTFCIELSQDSNFNDLNKFKNLQKLVHQYSQEEMSREEFVDQFSDSYHPVANSKKSRWNKTGEKLNLPETHFSGHNMWILKVTKLNRGRGIYVIQANESCDEILELIKELQKGIIINSNENSQASGDISKENTKDSTFSNISSAPRKIQSSTFVIQKYIERPLLINKRKFDIRVWVLLTVDLKVCFFKEGYLRTSCEDFSLGQDAIDKTYIHLTNNAVQKYSENYGQFEDGNQLSFNYFQDYIDEHYSDSGINVKRDLVERMKESIVASFKAAESCLFKDNKHSQFELFGYDFIIDENFETWLIEINTNPCLEESSKILQALIPRMVDDALKLTLDPLFKKNLRAKLNEGDHSDADLDAQESTFPVEGYENTENLWEEIM